MLPVHPGGDWQIPAEAFEAAVCADTRMIVCTHAANLTGDPVDIEAVGRICRRRGILFVLDASQTAGVLDIDMERMNIDVVCFTGHKSLMGPPGNRRPVREKGSGDPSPSGGGNGNPHLRSQAAPGHAHGPGGGHPKRPWPGRTLGGPGVAGEGRENCCGEGDFPGGAIFTGESGNCRE